MKEKRGPGRPKGGKGTANRNIDYRCDTCKRSTPRSKLAAKRVHYTTVSRPPRAIRSRTVAWLCESCMKEEPEFNVENRRGFAHKEIPGGGEN